MEARTNHVTGETLLTPGENPGSKVSPITKAREKGGKVSGNRRKGNSSEEFAERQGSEGPSLTTIF
jgi:hypothetical protein